MDWRELKVNIIWAHCVRRRWQRVAELSFSAQERKKDRNVLLYWWAGRGQRRLPSGMSPVYKNVCHWSRPGWVYECMQSTRNPLGVTAIHFDLVDYRGRVVEQAKLNLPPEQLRVRSPKLVEEITRMIANRARDINAGASICAAEERAMNEMLRALLLTLTQDTVGKPQPLAGPSCWEDLNVYILDHLHDLPNVTGLAKRVGYTRSHFSRVFKMQTGLSPKQYLVNARVNLAKEMLCGTTLSIEEVARNTGYQDLSNFFRHFRARTQTTPALYRIQQTCPSSAKAAPMSDITEKN